MFASNRAESGVFDIYSGNMHIENSSFTSNMANIGNIYLASGNIYIEDLLVYW